MKTDILYGLLVGLGFVKMCHCIRQLSYTVYIDYVRGTIQRLKLLRCGKVLRKTKHMLEDTQSENLCPRSVFKIL